MEKQFFLDIMVEMHKEYAAIGALEHALGDIIIDNGLCAVMNYIPTLVYKMMRVAEEHEDEFYEGFWAYMEENDDDDEAFYEWIVGLVK